VLWSAVSTGSSATAPSRPFDAAYAVATAVLSERTGDRVRFPLVCEELIVYGFRRSGYACRIPAIVVCGLTALVTLALARWSLVPLG
jgi:hypothetical protein